MAESSSRRESSFNRDRSATVDDVEDSDAGSHNENGEAPSGKPGRKKNPNSQAARRDQNRIAQREFRLRKQQRIRDLEARVEILSGGKDEALGEMRNILKDLMAENHVLRGLLRSLSGFIGEGAGGLLPKLGWTMRDFEAYVNKSETDTAYEGYQRRKQDGQPAGRKRPADEPAGEGSAGKRARAGEHGPDSFPALMPVNPIAPGGGIFPAPGVPANTRSPQESSILSDLMRPANGSPMFNMSGSAGSPPFSAGSGGQFPPSYMTMGVDGALPPMPFVQGTPNSQTSGEEEQRPDPKHEEAQKLVSYHLDNYKRNSQYCLPTSLRPTLVQRTVPHESVIDRVPHPELRDKLILLRGRFNLVDCLHDYGMSVTIHGDDVLAHSNWEISETWLRKYSHLVEQQTLNITNKWRRERGVPELTLRDIGAPDA